MSGKQLLFQLRGSDAARRGGRAHQALSNPFLTHSSHNWNSHHLLTALISIAGTY